MLPRYPLIQRPTPCHRLDRASTALGIDLWMKRDDLTGFALGGNKGRKIEYFIADAVQGGFDTIVTCGASQSNFIRQIGVACAMAGLRCVAIIMDQPYEDGHRAEAATWTGRGNLVLNDLSGVETILYTDSTWDVLFQLADQEAARLESEGRKVKSIPIGGSNALGAYAFFEAAAELPPCDTVIMASSSGSTQMGLAVAFRDAATRVIGISCDPEEALVHDHWELGNQLCEMIGQPRLPKDIVDLRYGFVGPGYGVPSQDGNEALRWLAKVEGIFLDPIYSAKAFAGLIAMAQAGELQDQRVVFWHTGGTPTLFAYY